MAAPNRPLSPHLQVYKPQMTSFTSILHRLTGLALAAGAAMVTFWLWAMMEGGDMLVCFQNFVQTPVGKIMLAGWLVAFSYHFLNGVRHMFWDTGRGLTIKFANTSAWIILLSSVAVTALIWCYAAG